MALRSIAVSEIADDVYRGLTASPKSLPPKLFYDAAGSALFEEITRLPEYYLTRTELGILRERAGEIARRTAAGVSIVELGAGSAAKTHVLLDAFCDGAPTARRSRAAWGAYGRRNSRRVSYFPVDISPSALREANASLSRAFPALPVVPKIADLGADLQFLRDIPAPRLVLYIGSSIGNMEVDEADDFLRRVRLQLEAGDTLLLGTDLIKRRALLLAAYNDSAGVTARFNLNLLARINRELGGRFDLRAFRHEAVWSARDSRIEIYIESLRDQQVRIDALGRSIHFARGERMHTENSHKYTVAGIRRTLRKAGFVPRDAWTDPKRWFAVHWADVI